LSDIFPPNLFNKIPCGERFFTEKIDPSLQARKAFKKYSKTLSESKLMAHPLYLLALARGRFYKTPFRPKRF
jgi:hypothetical protein